MRTCEIEGCASPHRARGLCSTCYNQRHQSTRHQKISISCAWCGKACIKDQGNAKKYAENFCSYDCRGAMRAMRAGIDRCEITKWHPAHPDYTLPLPVLRVTPPTVERPPRIFVAGFCRHCGKPFVDRQTQARSCSERCTRKYWTKLYKDEVPERARRYIYERDGWRCQICRRGIPVAPSVPHPLAATIDHIVPRCEGGTHDPANLRAAHFICNTRRNNKGGNEQLALIG